jgi:hypothetical protein
MRINAVDPGYTATDLNFNSGTQTVSEGTDAIVGMGDDRPRWPDWHLRQPRRTRGLVIARWTPTSAELSVCWRLHINASACAVTQDLSR